MSKEIQKKEAAEVAKPLSNEDLGIEDFDQNDIVVQWLSICEGMSDAVMDGAAKAGDIFNGFTKKVVEQPLTVIPVYTKKTRRKYVSKKNPKEGIDCSSEDLKTGNTYGECAVCKFQTDFQDEDGNRGWASCNEERFFIFLIKENEKLSKIPYKMGFSRSRFKAAQTILMMVKDMNTPLFELSFTVSTKMQESNGNKFHVPVIGIGKDLTDAEKAVAKSTRQTILSAVESGNIKYKEEKPAEAETQPEPGDDDIPY